MSHNSTNARKMLDLDCELEKISSRKKHVISKYKRRKTISNSSNLDSLNCVLKIIKMLRTIKIECFCRQCHDKEANMSEKKNGTVAELREVEDKALF